MFGWEQLGSKYFPLVSVPRRMDGNNIDFMAGGPLLQVLQNLS
jgi:hypothetical protein